ncbi:hypothetical protein QW131_32010 [Roseibium salinum]|nr:hypothetical protein [Roseibium salinum]
MTGGGAINLSSEEDSLTLAGGLSIGIAERDVDAIVNGAVIHSDGLDINAKREEVAVAISAGVGAAARSDVAVAGSVDVNVYTDNIHAKLSDSYVRSTGDVIVGAKSDMVLVSIAGAVGVSAEGTGAAASFGVSSTVDEIHAYVDNSDVRADGNFRVDAVGNHTVVSVTASVGVGLLKSAVAGQFSLHLVKKDVDARVGDGSLVVAGNNAAIIADDLVTLVTVTGGAVVGNNNAVGVSVSSTNIYGRTVKAHIDDGASVTAQSLGDALGIDLDGNTDNGAELSVNGLAVHAKADDDIINVVMGAAVSGKICRSGLGIDRYQQHHGQGVRRVCLRHVLQARCGECAERRRRFHRRRLRSCQCGGCRRAVRLAVIRCHRCIRARFRPHP